MVHLNIKIVNLKEIFHFEKILMKISLLNKVM